MFLNESQNRLQQYAIPTLYLTTKLPSVPSNNLMINGLPFNGLQMGDKLFNVSMLSQTMNSQAYIVISLLKLFLKLFHE